jgi:hypothetical protein
MIRNDADAKAAAGDLKVTAVGVATPAVLTEELAGQCSDYITSVVLMVRTTATHKFDIQIEILLVSESQSLYSSFLKLHHVSCADGKNG